MSVPRKLFMERERRRAVSELCTHAAEILDLKPHRPDHTDCACYALSSAEYSGVVPRRIAGPARVSADVVMDEHFKEDARNAGQWYGYWGANFGAQSPSAPWGGYDMKQARDCRVLMLLLVAQLALDPKVSL